MGAITTTGGVALPTAQDLFGGSSTSAPPPAPTGKVEGPVVSGPGGTTALPEAAPSDFQSTNPTPLDKPHPQYPGLIQSHVAVLQAIGTPEAVIAQLNASQPQAEYLDRYIQGEIMQNPEGWDQYVGNPQGTARAGLKQLAPNIQLPAPGQGNAGYMPDGSPVSGIQIPGVSSPISSGPLLDPTTGQPKGSGLMTGLIAAAAIVGVGLLAWKFMKGRGAAKETEAAARNLIGGNGGAGGLDFLAELTKGGGGWRGKDAADLTKALMLHTSAGGGAIGAGADIAASAAAGQRAATMFAHLKDIGPVEGSLMQAIAGATAGNISVERAAEIALANRGMGVLETLARNGSTLDGLATARALTTQLTGQVASGGAAASKLNGLTQALAGLVNTVAV